MSYDQAEKESYILHPPPKHYDSGKLIIAFGEINQFRIKVPKYCVSKYKKHTFFSTLEDKQNMGLSGDSCLNIDFMLSTELEV